MLKSDIKTENNEINLFYCLYEKVKEDEFFYFVRMLFFISFFGKFFEEI